MIVADTGGMIVLFDAGHERHAVVRDLYRARRAEWILPWAILPEIDHLSSVRLGQQTARQFVEDLEQGLYTVDASVNRDLPRAAELMERHRDLRMGLVDAVVMAQAERHQASVIVTTDARHFRAVKLNIDPPPRLVPLDP